MIKQRKVKSEENNKAVKTRETKEKDNGNKINI